MQKNDQEVQNWREKLRIRQNHLENIIKNAKNEDFWVCLDEKRFTSHAARAEYKYNAEKMVAEAKITLRQLLEEEINALAS